MSNPIDSYRLSVKRLIEAAGLTLAEASRRMGRNHAYLQQFMTRASPRYLREDARESLAAVLGVSPDELRPAEIHRANAPNVKAAQAAIAIDDNVVMTIALAALRATGVKFTVVQESRAIAEAANIRDRIAAGTPVETIKAELA